MEEQYIGPKWFPETAEENDEISAYKTFNLVIKGKQFELSEDEIETLIQELQNAVSRKKPKEPKEEKYDKDFEKIVEQLEKLEKYPKENTPYTPPRPYQIPSTEDFWKEHPHLTPPQIWCDNG